MHHKAVLKCDLIIFGTAFFVSYLLKNENNMNILCSAYRLFISHCYTRKEYYSCVFFI